MSIEKRAGTFSRAFRTLIGKHASLANPIKDLKDLSVLRVTSSIDIKVLRTLAHFRPMRTIDIKVLRTEETAPFFTIMRKDGEGQALALRKQEPFLLSVARGPVPRDRCMARDRPSPYVNENRLCCP